MRRPTTRLMVSLALVAGGCGGSGDPERAKTSPAPGMTAYVERIEGILDPVFGAREDYAGAAGADAARDPLVRLERAARRGAAALGGVPVPDAAAGIHERVVAGLRRLAEDLAVALGRTPLDTDAAQDAVVASIEVERAVNELYTLPAG